MKKAISILLKTAVLGALLASLAPTIFLGSSGWDGYDSGQDRSGGVVQWGRAIAQQFTIPDSSTWVGKFLIARNGAGPTSSNGTVDNGSTDFVGKLTPGNNGGSTVLTFSAAYKAAPLCLVVDPTATSTVRPVYSTSTTALTINSAGWNNGDSLHYLCVGTQR